VSFDKVSINILKIFRLEFCDLQLRINEAGIYGYQYSLARNDRDMMYIKRTKAGGNEDQGPQPFTLHQTSLVFIFYGFFLGFAVLIFGIEVVMEKAQRCKCV
jgi:hypothetical protein